MADLKPLDVDVLLFDLDGTLVNSLKDIASSVNYVMGEMKLPPVTDVDIKRFVGNGVRVLLERCLGPYVDNIAAHLEPSLALYRSHHERQCTVFVKPYPHVVETLIHFSSKRKAVITNKPFSFADRILKHLKLRPYFEILLGGDSLSDMKPDPAPILHVLDRWKCPPRKAIMIGDGVQDVTSGKAAGILTCGVRGGFGDADALEDADILVDDLIELKERLI